MSMESVQRRYDQENYDYSSSVDEDLEISGNRDEFSPEGDNPAENEGQVSGRYRSVENGRGSVAGSGVSDAERQKVLDEAAGSTGEDPTTALVTLKKEIKAADIPQKSKQEYLNKVEELLKKAMKNQLEDPSEVDNLKSEFQSVLEENPSFAKRLVDYVKSQNTSQEGMTEEKVKKAMKKYNFTEDSLSKLVLPGDQDLSTRLMGFLKEVNPNLAQTLANDAEKGFSAKSISDIQGILNVVYPQGVNTDMVVNLIDQTEKTPWDAEQVKNTITGDKVHYDGDYNNRFYDVNKFVDNLHGMSTGQAYDIQSYLNTGRNSVDNGARNKGLEVRKFLTGLFDYCHQNPYLFRHYLKQIPETALLAMKDVLDYRGGGGNDGNTKNIGERWDTTQSSNILQWTVNGGSVPAELQSETARDMNSQISQSQSQVEQ